MKLKEVDYEINEELFITSSILKMLSNDYDSKIPEEVMKSIDHTICLADKYLAKDFIPEADIKKMKLVSRISFDMDTIKDVEKNGKKNK